jgi:serine/threonine protein kinase
LLPFCWVDEDCPFVSRFIGYGTLLVGTPAIEQHFLVMSLLGTNLSELRKMRPDNRFSMSTTALLGRQMIEGLRWVHQSGYLHRDVKPVRPSYA